LQIEENDRGHNEIIQQNFRNEYIVPKRKAKELPSPDVTSEENNVLVIDYSTSVPQANQTNVLKPKLKLGENDEVQTVLGEGDQLQTVLGEGNESHTISLILAERRCVMIEASVTL